MKKSADNPIAALGMLGIGIVLLSLQDAIIKSLSADLSFWQFQLLRSTLNIAFLILLAYLSGGLAQLRLKRARYVFLRSSLLAITMVCLFGAAPSLSFAQMASGLYTYPLFITILAMPILGERIGIWRFSALMIGAVGAILLLKPFAEDFRTLQTLPICAGFFYALNVMAVRRLGHDEAPLAMGIMTASIFFCTGLIGLSILTLIPAPEIWQQAIPFLALPWLPLSFVLVGWIALTSALNVVGNLCNVYAYQKAESSILAPLDFCYLLFAALWGRALFDEHLDTGEYTGMALIACAGVVITLREQYRSKKTA